MNPPDVYDANGAPYHERREAPGRRAADIEHQLASSAVSLAKRGWRGYLAAVAIGGAVSSAVTFVLLVFGLKVGGATDLAAVRSDVLRRDSATELWRRRSDSVAANYGTRVAHLEEADRFKMFLLCNIAEQVGARSGGLCQTSTLNPPKP